MVRPAQSGSPVRTRGSSPTSPARGSLCRRRGSPGPTESEIPGAKRGAEPQEARHVIEVTVVHQGSPRRDRVGDHHSARPEPAIAGGDDRREHPPRPSRTRPATPRRRHRRAPAARRPARRLDHVDDQPRGATDSGPARPFKTSTRPAHVVPSLDGPHDQPPRERDTYRRLTPHRSIPISGGSRRDALDSHAQFGRSVERAAWISTVPSTVRPGTRVYALARPV